MIVQGVMAREGKVAVVKRNGLLELPGGKVEKGENPEEAMKREWEEETGGEIRKMEWISTQEWCMDGKYEFARAYRVWGDAPRAKWVDMEKFLENTWPEVKIWLPRALQGEKIYGRFSFKGRELVEWEVYSMGEVEEVVERELGKLKLVLERMDLPEALRELVVSYVRDAEFFMGREPVKAFELVNYVWGMLDAAARLGIPVPDEYRKWFKI